MRKEKGYQEYMALIEIHPLFRGFDDEEILELLDYLSAAVVVIAAGNPINTIGTRADNSVQSCCILAGRAQHVKYDLWGKCSILDCITPGGLLGFSHTFLDLHHHTTSVLAVESCVCLFLDLRMLNREDKDCPAILLRLSVNIIRILAEWNSRLFKKADILSRRTLREKTLTYLSYVRDEQQSDTFDIPFSRQELADFLYVDRSSLSTELGKLQQEGLLEFNHNRFRLKYP